MVFAALLILSPFPQIVETLKTVSGQTAVILSISAKDSSHPSELPSMPLAKVKSGSPEAGAVADDSVSTVPAATGASVAPETSPLPQPIALGNAAIQPSPLKPVIRHPNETHREKTLWYALAIAGHSAAAFDAWSTRRALSMNDGTEANPLLRPFAHSGMLYAATQVSPLLMDYIGKRMMVSRHPMVRRVWWVPQTVGATVSFTAGVHNIGIVH
jgi:hypothetical protein